MKIMTKLEEKLIELGYYQNPNYNNIFYKRINDDYNIEMVIINGNVYGDIINVSQQNKSQNYTQAVNLLASDLGRLELWGQGLN